MNWEFEYPLVKDLKVEVYKMRENETLPASFIQKVKVHHDSRALYKKPSDGKPKSAKYLYEMVYDFSRFQERISNKEPSPLTPLQKEEGKKINRLEQFLISWQELINSMAG